MEYALRIISPDQEVLVSITQMLALGEDETRGSEYRCPSGNCGVPIFPAIPEREKEGRVFAPRPYFRAGQSNPHLPGCLGDGAVQADDAGVLTIKTRTVTTISDATLADQPVRFNERRQSGTDAGGESVTGDDGAPTTRGGRSDGKSGGQSHISERSTGQVGELARVYEAFPNERAHLRIKIQGCPAKTYAEAFWPVEWAVMRRSRPAARHVFYGRYGSHVEFPSGISILFEEMAPDGKRLGIWIDNALEPGSVRQDLIGRLHLAQGQGDSGATVYVLGVFQSWQNYKYTVEVAGLNYVYISLSNDDIQQP